MDYGGLLWIIEYHELSRIIQDYLGLLYIIMDYGLWWIIMDYGLLWIIVHEWVSSWSMAYHGLLRIIVAHRGFTMDSRGF